MNWLFAVLLLLLPKYAGLAQGDARVIRDALLSGLPAYEKFKKEGEQAIEEIASLTDPKQLALLKGEEADLLRYALIPRFQKCLWYLTKASEPPEEAIDQAMVLNQTAGTPYAKAVKLALLKGYRFGSPASPDDKSLRITKGGYAGQEAIVSRIISPSVCAELQNQIFNLQLVPESTMGKKDEAEQLQFAEQLHRDGLLSADGLAEVRKACQDEPEAPGTSPAQAEAKRQIRLNEESKQMELELVRAERKGLEAVYEVWVKRLKKLGQAANKSRDPSEVLIFEQTLNSTMEIWERKFEEGLRKNPIFQSAESMGKDVSFIAKGMYEDEKKREVAYLESFLDESLRAK